MAMATQQRLIEQSGPAATRSISASAKLAQNQIKDQSINLFDSAAAVRPNKLIKGKGMFVASSASLFAAFDKDADGRISPAELRLCMKATLGEDVSAEDADALVASVDADGDGVLDGAEFERLVLHVGAAGVDLDDDEERHRGLRAAFGMYEMEGQGCITPTSLKRMLGRLGAHQEIDDCRAMICRFDLNGDGVLSFDEFKIMMNA